MKKTFLPYQPRQSYLLPPSPQQWLRPGHLAYFILDLVEALDLKAIYAHYEGELRGKPPHDPRLMVALLLYGYATGVTSARLIERKTYEDVAFRVLSGDTHPDHVCISTFRRLHLPVLAGLFQQVLRLCQEAGLIRLGHVALDGTKVKANASKHKAMSYKRMQEQEALLARKVQQILEEAERVDQEEDALYGKDKRGDELPEEFARAEGRRERIRAALRALEAEAKAGHSEKPDKSKHGGSGSSGSDGAGSGSGNCGGGSPPMPSHRVSADADGKPMPKAQRNFTDPESRIMKGSDGGFIQAYNAQIVVDDAHQIIVAQAVTNQPPDVEHALPMLAQVRDNCGQAPAKASCDAGYFSEENVLGALQMGIDPYIATGRLRHGDRRLPRRRTLPRAMTVKAWMAHRLATDEGSAVYRRRKAIVEPVFGQTKEARGLRQFRLRGQQLVAGEWALICTGHNIGKLHRARQVASAPS